MRSQTTVNEVFSRHISASLEHAIDDVDVELNNEQVGSLSVDQIAEKYIGEQLLKAMTSVEINQRKEGKGDVILFICQGKGISKIIFILAIMAALFIWHNISSAQQVLVPVPAEHEKPRMEDDHVKPQKSPVVPKPKRRTPSKTTRRSPC